LEESNNEENKRFKFAKTSKGFSLRCFGKHAYPVVISQTEMSSSLLPTIQYDTSCVKEIPSSKFLFPDIYGFLKEIPDQNHHV